MTREGGKSWPKGGDEKAQFKTVANQGRRETARGDGGAARDFLEIRHWTDGVEKVGRGGRMSRQNLVPELVAALSALGGEAVKTATSESKFLKGLEELSKNRHEFWQTTGGWVRRKT
jgi:hypothetical protein